MQEQGDDEHADNGKEGPDLSAKKVTVGHPYDVNALHRRTPLSISFSAGHV